jgi:hypothetical protein
MRTVMVRYKVKPERVAENEGLIAKVYEQLTHESPLGLHYATYKLEDGVSFVHIATLETDGNNPLLELSAFKAFTEGVKERCDEPPVSTPVTRVGSYRQIMRMP